MALVHVTETPRADWGDPDDIRGWVRLIAQVPTTTMQSAGYTIAKQTVLGYQEVSYRTGTLTTRTGQPLLLNPNSGSSNEVINVPTGTVWELTIIVPGRNVGPVVRTMSVPDITTPISVEDCLSPAPGTLPPPGSEILAHKNQANGYAGLDSSGLISLSQLAAVLAKSGGTMTGQLVLAGNVAMPLVIPDPGGAYNGFTYQGDAPDLTHPMVKIRASSTSTGTYNVFVIADKGNAPIGWFNNAGGLSVNDMIRMVDDSGSYNNGIGFEYLNESNRKGFATVFGHSGGTGGTFADGGTTYSRDAFKAYYLRLNDSNQIVASTALSVGVDGTAVPIVISPSAGPAFQPGFSIGLTGDARLYRGAIGSGGGWLSDSAWEFTGSSVSIDGSPMKTLSVRAAATGNISSKSGFVTLDGVSCTAGDRVLLPYQTGADGNIYVVAAGSWTLATDADTSAKIAGAVVSVQRGTLNGGKQFANTFTAGSTLGVTPMPWYRILNANDISSTVAPSINSPGALTSASTGQLDVHLFEQTQAATLRGLAAKIGGASTQGVVVVWEGDSINDGQGATTPGVTRHVDRLNAFAATLFTGKAPGKGFKPVQDAPGVPYAANQWANLGAGVADTTAGLGGNGWKTTANAQTFGDTETFDVMDLVYQAVPTGGATYVVKDEAGTTLATINTTDGALSRPTIKVQRITMPTGLISHAWTIAQSGAGTGKVCGYIPHVGTAAKGLLFLNIARGGTDTAYWQTNIQSVTDLITALGTAGSVVAGWIHGTGGNDSIANQASGTNTPSPATVESQLESISNSVATAAPLIARILLGEYYVSKPTASKTNVGVSNWQTLWLPQMEKAAYNTGAAYIDLFAIFGNASENSGTIANGLTMDNGLHFGDAGQQMYANWLWANLVPQPGQLVAPLLVNGANPMTGDIDMGGNALTDSSATPYVRFKKFLRALMPSGAIIRMDEANDGVNNGPRIFGYKDATAESGNFPKWAIGSYFGKGFLALGDDTIGPNGYMKAVSTGVLQFLKPDLSTRADLQAGSLDLSADASTTTQAIRLSQLNARSDGMFGDGSDGAGNISGSTTLTKDMNYTSLSVTGTLTTGGFRVMVRGALTGNGTIRNNGTAAAANVGGAGANAGYYGGGATGASGSTGAGTAGTSLASNRMMGGNGAAGGLGSGGAGGGVSTGTGIVSAECGTNLANIATIAPGTLWNGRTQPANAVQQSLAGGSAGGTGGGDGTVAGGGGGGAGGVVCLFARDASGFTGTIQANGGAGGNAAGTNCGGGGGGGGGFCSLVTYTLPTGAYTIQATGGTGGTKTGTGVAGSTGSNGNTLAVALS